MTNRENLIKALKGEHDDWAWTESVIAYEIECPYQSYEKGLPCDELESPWNTLDVCGPCKAKWLDEEVSE